MPTTPVSLLHRIQQSHAPADWVRFAKLYSPLILYWASQFGLQEADAADLAQDVLTRVWRQIGSYQREEGKRFRGWLWAVTRNRWRERVRKRPAPAQSDSRDEPADPLDTVGKLVEDEYNAYLVNRAMQLMRSEFEPNTWQACWSFVVEGKPAQEVAGRLRITPNAVYLAKARVLRRLREELEGLLE
jgi:RNA polymerase sigma-70 factor (ECF subfamily)